MSSPTIINILGGTQLTLMANATLVIDNDQCFVVDPGSFSSLEELKASVWKSAKIDFSKVNAIVYTHLHYDHYNYFHYSDHVKSIYLPRREFEYYFELQKHKDTNSAYITYLESTHDYISPVFMRQFIHYANNERYDYETCLADERIKMLGTNTQISENVSTLDLAGHSPGLLGLKIEAPEGSTIVASDAALFEKEYYDSRPKNKVHLIMFDQEKWVQSRKTLKAENAYRIIPGHGHWFYP